MTQRVVVLGDVGPEPYLHVGDEAMLEACLTELGRRIDIEWTVITANPTDTAERYGVPTAGRLGFSGLTPRARDERLEHIRAAAAGQHCAATDSAQIYRFVDLVGSAGLALIAGGGNLNSTWPEHVYERAALALVAQQLGVPVALSGQSLGPQLSERDGVLVAATVTSAAFVGVRESASADVARRLGVPLDRRWYAPDDAMFLPDQPPVTGGAADTMEPDRLTAEPASGGGFIAATFHDYGGPFASDALAADFGRLLDQVGELTGLDILLIPHLGSDGAYGAPGADEAYHELIARHAKPGRVRLIGVQSAGVTAWLTRRSALVISNRYHPVVFGTSAGRLSVGVAVDDYTQAKIEGALEWGGLAAWCLSIASVRDGSAIEAIRELWLRQSELQPGLDALAGENQQIKSAYWDALAEVVRGHVPAAAGPLATRAQVVAAGNWTYGNGLSLTWSQLLARRDGDARRQIDDIAGERDDLARTVALAQEQQRSSEQQITDLLEALDLARRAADSAREINGFALAQVHEAHDRASVSATRLERGDAALEELARFERTKLVRWSRRPRTLYARLLHLWPAARRTTAIDLRDER